MTFECKLKDIRTNADVWKMTGREESEMRCTVLDREDYEFAYKLDNFYRTEEPTNEREYIQNILEQNVFYLYGRIFVYGLRVLISALKGYFQIGYDRTYIREGENISDDVLLYYAEGSDTPEVISRGEIYDMAVSFMAKGSDISAPDETGKHNQGDDQMERIKFYYSAGYDSVESHFRRAQVPETILRDFYRDDMDSVIWTKEEAENYLAAQNRLYTNITDVIEALLSGERSLYASLHIDDVEYTYMNRWEPYGVHKIYHYGCEEINMQIWFTRYLTNLPWRESYKDDGDEYHLGHEHFRSMDFFGRIVCGDDCHRIDAVPVFMTNMKE